MGLNSLQIPSLQRKEAENAPETRLCPQVNCKISLLPPPSTLPPPLLLLPFPHSHQSDVPVFWRRWVRSSSQRWRWRLCTPTSLAISSRLHNCSHLTSCVAFTTAVALSHDVLCSILHLAEIWFWRQVAPLAVCPSGVIHRSSIITGFYLKFCYFCYLSDI